MDDFEKKIDGPLKKDLVDAIECGQLAGIQMPRAFMEFAYTVDEFWHICLCLFDLQEKAPDEYHSSMCEGTKGGWREFRDITHKILVEYFDSDVHPNNFCEGLAEEMANTLNDLVPPSAEEVDLAASSVVTAPPAVLRFASTTKRWLGLVRWIEVVTGEIYILAD